MVFNTYNKKTQEIIGIRMERIKRLDKPLSKKIDKKVAESLYLEQGGEGLLDRLKHLYDFEIEDNCQKWLIEHSKNYNELIYAFQLFLQRAINKGRGFTTLDDLKLIRENIDFSILNSSKDPIIGSVHTLGIIDEKIEKVEIRSCAVPVKKGKGTITCIEKLEINYFPLRNLIRNFNIYIKIYPKIPENHGQWEAALITAIYSSIFNKVMPVSSLVLGGMTKEGRIRPIDVEIINKFKDKQVIVFLSDKNKDNKVKILMNTDYFNYVEHIEEIISSLQITTKTAKNSILRDFLCE